MQDDDNLGRFAMDEPDFSLDADLRLALQARAVYQRLLLQKPPWLKSLVELDEDKLDVDQFDTDVLFPGAEFISFLIETGFHINRQLALKFARKLLQNGIIKHGMLKTWY